MLVEATSTLFKSNLYNLKSERLVIFLVALELKLKTDTGKATGRPPPLWDVKKTSWRCMLYWKAISGYCTWWLTWQPTMAIEVRNDVDS